MTGIRKAGTDDIMLIKELTMQVWPQTYIPIVGEDQVAYMLDRFYTREALMAQMEQGHSFIIGYDGDEPVAFASWSEIEPHVYKLHKLYISTGQQGKGVGRSMISYIVDEIRKEAATFLCLNVNRYNNSAKAFYEKVGFKHVTDEDIDIGNGYFMNDHVLNLAIQ